MQYNSFKSRLLSVLLMFTLLLSLISVTVFAADPPVLTKAEVSAEGDLELTFSTPMQAPADTQGYSVRRSDGVTYTVTSAVLMADTTKIKLVLSTEIFGGQVFDISYDASKGSLRSSDDELLASFTLFEVTNELPHPTITSDDLPEGMLGIAYSYSFTASGGTDPYTFYKESGSFPAGLSLESSTGALSGIPDTYTGTFTFRIKVVDANSAQDIKSFSININPAGDITPPAFTEGYPRAGAIQSDGSRQVRVVINSPEKAYYHFVLLPDGASAPSKEQVKNGQDANGNQALKFVSSGSYKTDSIDTGTFGLLHNTDYDIYVVLQDDAGNISEPAKVDVKTPPAAEFFDSGYPAAGTAQPDGSKQVQVLVKVKDTQKAGMIYYVLVPDTSNAPSIEQICNGKDSTGADALDAGTITCDNGAESSLILDGDNDLTPYDVYLLSGDTYYGTPYTTCTEIFKVEVTTPPAAPVSVTGIAIKNQPADLVYVAGENLDLSGLEVTLTYSDSSTEDVAFANFADKGIDTDPAHGAVMVVETHHNKPVTVSCNGKISNTNNLTVTAPPIVNTPPSWPAGGTMTANSTTRTSTVLNWSPAQDDAGVTSYRIYMGNSIIRTVEGVVHTCEVTGLSPSTTYTFQVQAGDGNNKWTTDGPTVTIRTDSSGSGSSGGRGNSGGGGSSGSKSSNNPQPVAKVLDAEGNLSKTVTVSMNGSTGTASVKVDSVSLGSAFDMSEADNNGIKTVEINIPQINGAKSYDITLPAKAFSAENLSSAVTIKTSLAAVTMPGNMIASSAAAGAQNVTLTVSKGDISGLNPAVQTQIGNKPIIELGLKLDDRQISWSNEDAPVIVSIPYTPTAAELQDPEHIVVWYIDGSGRAVSIPNGRYYKSAGAVTFSITHFSRYAVVNIHKTFNDLENTVWAKKPIEVLASKGILEGTSGTEYDPQTNITRADFLCFLVRTLGVDAKVDGNFDDIAEDAYYYREIAIAKRLGITSGTGNNEFKPEESITRQDMIVLTERTLRIFNRLNEQAASSSLDKFTDRSLIAAYASNSIATAVKEGLIVGSNDAINPLGNTTRAEAAVFLYRIYNKY